MSEEDPHKWREYIVRARIKPQNGRARSLSTEPERVREYLTSNNWWTNIVEVEVSEFLNQEVLL